LHEPGAAPPDAPAGGDARAARRPPRSLRADPSYQRAAHLTGRAKQEPRRTSSFCTTPPPSPPPLLLLPGAPVPSTRLCARSPRGHAADRPTGRADRRGAPARARLARLLVRRPPPPASCLRSSSTPTPSFGARARAARLPRRLHEPSRRRETLFHCPRRPHTPRRAGPALRACSRWPSRSPAYQLPPRPTPPAPTTTCPSTASTLDHRATRPHSARPTSDTTTSIDPHDASRALAPPPPTSRAPRRLRAPHPASEPPRGRSTNSS